MPAATAPAACAATAPPALAANRAIAANDVGEGPKPLPISMYDLRESAGVPPAQGLPVPLPPPAEHEIVLCLGSKPQQIRGLRPVILAVRPDAVNERLPVHHTVDDRLSPWIARRRR